MFAAIAAQLRRKMVFTFDHLFEKTRIILESLELIQLFGRTVRCHHGRRHHR